VTRLRAAADGSVADVRAEHVSYGTDHRVVIRKSVRVKARAVTIETEKRRRRRWHLEIIESDRPVDFLPSGGTYQHMAVLYLGSPSRVNCTVRWLNPDDREGSSRQTLSAF